MNNQMALQMNTQQNEAYAQLNSNQYQQARQNQVKIAFIVLIIQQFYIYGIGWLWALFDLYPLVYIFYVSLPILLFIQVYFNNLLNCQNNVRDLIALVLFNLLIGIFYAILFIQYESGMIPNILIISYPLFLFILLIITIIVQLTSKICQKATIIILLFVPWVVIFILNFVTYYSYDFITFTMVQWVLIIIMLMTKYINSSITNPFIIASYLNGYLLQIYIELFQITWKDSLLEHESLLTLDDTGQKNYQLKASMAFSAYTMWICLFVIDNYDSQYFINDGNTIIILVSICIMLNIKILAFIKYRPSIKFILNIQCHQFSNSIFILIYFICFAILMSKLLLFGYNDHDPYSNKEERLLLLPFFFYLLFGLSIGKVGFCLLPKEEQKYQLIYLFLIPIGIWICSIYYLVGIYILWTFLELVLVILLGIAILIEEQLQLTSKTLIMMNLDYMTGGFMLFQAFQTLIFRGILHLVQ